jgi:sec-independent protein translocase protein TatC
MPDQPSQTVSPPTPLSDLQAWLRSDDLRIRLFAYAVGALLALFLVTVPLPFPPSTSVAEMVMGILAAPVSGHLIEVGHHVNRLAAYWPISFTLAFALSHPILLKHAFDVTAPADLPDRSRRLMLTLIASLLAFLVGIVTSAMYLSPLLLRSTVSSIEIRWLFSVYVESVTTLAVTTGFAFEIPALVVGTIWLRVVGREQLTRWRPYVVLAAFVYAAWITPTPDPLNQTIVAIPICLLYELGLLLARRVPAESAQPTV